MMEYSLETRTGLPDGLRVLLDTYPRARWRSDPGSGPLSAFWLQMHLSFREMLAAMTADAAALADGRADPQKTGRRLGQTGGRFLEHLHGHHGIEDQHYFPVMTRIERRLAKGFDLLDADHQALDLHLAGFAGLANTLLRPLSQGKAAKGEAAAFHAGLIRLNRFLDRHLTDEEDLIIPVLLHHGEGRLD